MPVIEAMACGVPVLTSNRRNLELVEAMRTKEKRGSLLWVLDKTKTAMGARLMRSWVLRPLVDPVAISHRQSAVGELKEKARVREELSEVLSDILDIERLTAKAVYGTANAKDLRAIYQSISRLPELKAQAAAMSSGTLSAIARDMVFPSLP